MATSPRYPEDLTGTSVNNLVIDEPHNLVTKAFRSIAPTYGPYFTQSLIVKDLATNTVLTRDIHYKCLDVVGIPTAKTGKEICTIIVIISQSVSNTVSITYQALGGGYERTHEAIKLLIDNLLADNRPISWPNITNRPATFTPSHHLQAVGDVYGFEYIVVELERLKTAILLGDEIAHTEILGYIDSNIQALKNIVSDAEGLITLMGITGATDANNAAQLALAACNQAVLDIQTFNAELDSAIATVDGLITQSAASEQAAIDLIQQYS